MRPVWAWSSGLPRSLPRTSEDKPPKAVKPPHYGFFGASPQRRRLLSALFFVQPKCVGEVPSGVRENPIWEPVV